jgi:hypothetical protein
MRTISERLAGVTGGAYHFGGDGYQEAVLKSRPWLRDYVPGLNAWIAKTRAQGIR